MATSWYQDGITSDRYHTEPGALRALQQIASNDTELANKIMDWSWIFDEQLVIGETLVLEYLSGMDEQAPELMRLTVSFPWLADSIDEWEATALSRLYELVVHGHVDYAEYLAAAPWVTDGVTLMEVLFAINSLAQIAISSDANTGNPQAARQIMDLIRYPPNIIDLSLMNVMRTMGEHKAYLETGVTEHRSSRFERLFKEPWFADGLSQEERVYLIATIAADVERIYDPYAIDTRLIELPLAGPVHLWVVSHQPFKPQDTLTRMEQAVRGSEEFWQIPFPIKHVILYVLEPGIRGSNIGFMMFLDTHFEMIQLVSCL